MAPSGQLTAPAVQELLADASLAGDWALDGASSTIGLRSSSIWGLVPVKGVFGRFTGHGIVSPAGEVSGTITVAAGSIETKNTMRDKHLRSGDFFATDAFPHIIFSVDRLEPSSEGVTVAGQLTVRGRTRPVTFPATVSVAGFGEVWLDAEVHINRADFGLTWNQLGMASMNNTLTIHAVFARGERMRVAVRGATGLAGSMVTRPLRSRGDEAVGSAATAAAAALQAREALRGTASRARIATQTRGETDERPSGYR